MKYDEDYGDIDWDHIFDFILVIPRFVFRILFGKREK